MGYVCFVNKTVKTFHVGDSVRTMFCDEFFEIEEVQADCDELEHITANFSNIPHRKDKRTVHYFGDMAKFIIANW